MAAGEHDDGADARVAWNRRHLDRDRPVEPARFLTQRAEQLPTVGRALDVAGGRGRNAVWLAARGLDVTLVDVSDVAIARADAAAAAAGVELSTVRAAVTPEDLPAGPFDVVVVHHFLDRDVWRALPARLGPGGVLLVCQPTVRNLERHPRPSRRWLLDAGEITELASAMVTQGDHLEVVEVSEGWTDDGRHEARLVLRRADR